MHSSVLIPSAPARCPGPREGTCRRLGRAARGLSALVACLALVGAAAGCEILGAVGYKVFGVTVPAQYKPNPQVPLLVLVERHGTGELPEAEEMTRAICDELRANQVAPVIPPDRVQTLRDTEPTKFNRMGVSDIARAVGAGQVVYVNVKQCELEHMEGSDVVQLKVWAMVQVVDPAAQRRIWPEHTEAEEFKHETPHARITADQTPSTLRREALRQTGIEIARMFFDRVADTMKEENKGNWK